ncbi:MAG: hypothetical protein WKG00_19565 [Polyangiaceae bacterium]
MKLLSLRLESFRGAPDGAWSFVDPRSGLPHPVMVVTGGAASGKTSMLLAIAFLWETAAGHARADEYERCLRNGRAEGQVSATWLLDEDERRVAGVREAVQATEVGLGRRALPRIDHGLRRLFANYAHAGRTGKIELFGRGRSLGLHGPPRGGGPTRSEAIEQRLRTTRRADKYFDIPAWLLETATKDAQAARSKASVSGVLLDADAPDSLAAFREGVATLAPHLRFDGLHVTSASSSLRFLRREGAQVDLEDLSDSEQEAVLLAGTFARVGLRRSIVLVDAPEAVAAPEAHGRVLRAIAGLGADNQVIAASNAAAVMASVPPPCVIRL